MLALLSPLVVFALSVFSSTWAQTPTGGEVFKCTRYALANTTRPSCNERYTCAGQCTGPFIAAQNCFLLSNNTDFLGNPKPNTPANPAVPKVICDVGYGRNTAAASACLTKTGTYSCNGGPVAETYATCYKCVVP
ncbi:uncharacterized protein MELLADRAFT_124111 [Melampsora larici-populina 98AG31]|uniref:Secreted protein n=1 Tax=Melampsora larici-populina (strain 98AG31 / pathotype 3-4-7) TaxID=747676 RepID=F4RMG7_MELLP|nr:uncharacterized protein MELLADRAFT_124111 [Melampsora larici-populina 98AG31]EGG06477.1 secreted protein [Melampsora larici-populina 98AG31]